MKLNFKLNKLVILLLLIAVSFSSCLNSKKFNYDTPVDEEEISDFIEPEPEPELETEPELEIYIYQIDETLEFDDCDIVVSHVSTSQGNEFFKPLEDNDYVIITAAVKNNTAFEKSFSMLYNCALYDNIDENKMRIGDLPVDLLMDQNIEPDSVTSGSFVWEVPKKAKNVILKITPDLQIGESKYVNIDLQEIRKKETETQNQKPSQIEYQVGSVIKMDPLEITVEGGRTAYTSSLGNPRNGYKYVIIKIVSENKSEQNFKLYAFEGIRLLDSDNNSQKITLSADTTGTLISTIKPNDKSIGEIAFEVPMDFKSGTVEIRLDYLSRRVLVPITFD